MESKYEVRVDGIDVPVLRIRREMTHGFPCGPKELVVKDPALGMFALDQNFTIEVKDLSVPGIEWKRVTPAELIALLEADCGA